MCGLLGKNTKQTLLPQGASVADVFDTWTRQMGYPFIRVNTEGKTLKVQQGKIPDRFGKRFRKRFGILKTIWDSEKDDF